MQILLRRRAPGDSAIPHLFTIQAISRSSDGTPPSSTTRPSEPRPRSSYLQYANSQLLEFRHYDELMTKELENVYDFLEAGGHGLWSRWRTARAASKLHTVLLDVNELTERADNAIKFLSDMFSARLYKLTAPRKSESPTTKTWSKKNSRPPKTSTNSWSNNSTSPAPLCSS